MKLRVSGSHNKLDSRKVRKYVDWLARMLMCDSQLENLTLVVKFEYIKGYDAWCQCSNIYDPTKFELRINKSLGIRRTLSAIAHEIVHVKQYVSGQITDCPDTGTVKWLGEPNDSDYWDCPWEIEAYGREFGLVERFNKLIPINTLGRRPRPDRSLSDLRSSVGKVHRKKRPQKSRLPSGQ